MVLRSISYWDRIWRINNYCWSWAGLYSNEVSCFFLGNADVVLDDGFGGSPFFITIFGLSLMIGFTIIFLVFCELCNELVWQYEFFL